ncbi:MAG: hypothetical protein FD157_312 [Rhodocyclaceae bacterium]|nr:MAG: hypothetical protein FD157_312 [Rhodocyclaceae bacterium]TND02562.1 MAG: hypothetical protein FD118_1926 [Rhodocyclaceae bacterium]
MFMSKLGKLAAVWATVAMTAFSAGSAVATEQLKAVYQKTIEAYPAPKLDDVSGREYKFLIDVTKTKPNMDEAFKDIWTQVKTAAAKRGFAVTEKESNPLKIEMSTKEYFDTKDQALWSKGYIIRITTRFKDGKPNPDVSVAVKSVNEDVLRTLATPLAVVGVKKVKTEAEENIGFGPGGVLGGYIEKGSSFSVPLDSLGKFTLGDFGKYVPELLQLGLPAGTALLGTKAFSYRVKPGAIVLPGTEPCGVSMEAWSASEGSAPYLYDFSFGYGDLDFYAVAATHAAGEQFMIKVVQGDLRGLGGADGEKWGGSKVRKLMNRPIPAK